MFFQQAGKMALGSRVRFLAEKLTADAALIYEAYGNDLQPKWFPVFYVLTKIPNSSVTSIAKEIGHSHVSVSKILKEMSKAGLVLEKKDPLDGRRTILTLSRSGQKISRKIEAQYMDVRAAMDDLFNETKHDLWSALEEWDLLLSQKSVAKRVLAKRLKREYGEVQFDEYRPKYIKAFRALNEEWISAHFKLEKPDIEALQNPKKYILERGGHIVFALLDGKPVGACALVPMEPGVFELAKMAVTKEWRGYDVGLKLGRAVISKAKTLGADKIYLESNTLLKPAIRLYEKLGFKEVKGRISPYERCNIQMELNLRT